MRTLCMVVGIIIFSLSATLTVHATDMDIRPEKRTDTLVPGAFRVLHGVETFALAFIDGMSIRVALSQDGNTWSDAGTPVLNVSSSIIPFFHSKGVGVCGSWDGKKIAVVYSSDINSVSIVEGSVLGMTVAWRSPTELSLSAPIDSAPTCSILPNGLTLVALLSGKAMWVHEYVGGDDFIAHALPTVFNTNSSGRPSLATIGDVTIMAWQNFRERCSDVILAEGRMVTQGPISAFTFTPPKAGILSLTGGTELVPCTTEDPVLATDGKYFYVAVIQEQKGAPLHGWQVNLYKSAGADLNSGWAEYGRISIDVSNQTFVNLAASEAGNMVAAKNRLVHGGSVLGAKLYSGGTWQELGVVPWLGVGASSVPHRQFGLTRFGFNAPFRLPKGLTIPPKITQ